MDEGRCYLLLSKLASPTSTGQPLGDNQLYNFPRCRVTFKHSRPEGLMDWSQLIPPELCLLTPSLGTYYSPCTAIKFNTGYLTQEVFFYSWHHASKSNNWQSAEVSCLVAWIQRIQTMALFYTPLPSSSCISSWTLPVVLIFYHIHII